MTKMRTWQLCRTGTFGQDGATITKKDIDELCETFMPPRPISIGHDMAKGDNFPKFGDVLAVEKSGDGSTLIGQVKLHPSLEAQFDEGLYGGWSVTIPRRASDGKRYLHSLAICGATPPKIPGLEEIMAKSAFNDGDKVETVRFDEKIEYMEEVPMTEEEKKKMEALEAENKRLKEEAAKKADEKDDSDKKSDADEKRFSDMQMELKSLKEQNRRARIDAFNAKVGERIPKGVKDKVNALAEKFADSEPCEFSDDKGGKTSVPALDAFADILACGFQTDQEITKTVFEADEFSDTENGANKENVGAKIASKI